MEHRLETHADMEPGSGPTRLAKPEGVGSPERIKWPYLIMVIAFHLIAPLAFLPYLFSWVGLLLIPVGNYVFTSLGIGAGYHRLLTHRGFRCPKWLEYTLATLGICSLQDSPSQWVLVHRVHHQFSDERPDPHTPRVSAFWSHMGWMFVDNRDVMSAAAFHRYVPDIVSDPYYRWLTHVNWALIYVLHAILFFLVGLAIGALAAGTFAGALQIGLQFVMWGVVMRTIFAWHVTWGINSFAHMWGYRAYETREDSRNNWLFALLTNGEGWHNNHHADPRSARHGHAWWEIDLTWMTLVLLEKLGLVWDLKRPNATILNRQRLQDTA